MPENRSAPPGAITPHLLYDDAGKAIEWWCATLGFTERLRASDASGRAGHAQLNVGEGGAVFLGQSRREPSSDASDGLDFRSAARAGEPVVDGARR